MDEQTIKARIAIRDMLLLVLGDFPTLATEAFMNLVIDECRKKLPVTMEAVVDDAMDTDDALAFEKQAMQWGSYKGEPIGSIPTGYLVAVTDTSKFKQQLERYKRSRRFSQRQDSEDEDARFYG